MKKRFNFVLLVSTFLLISCENNVSESNECGWDEIFHNSTTNSCGTGRHCVPQPSGDTDQPETITWNTTCVDDSEFGTAGFYESCGPQEGNCPFGSMCTTSDGTYPGTCMPYCNDDYECPDNGICGQVWVGTNEFRTCMAVDDCDPVLNTGCEGDSDCYLFQLTTGKSLCIEGEQAGTLDVGETCTGFNSCLPGLACYSEQTTPPIDGTCMSLCDPQAPDCNEGETCQELGGGVGICTLSE